MPIYEFECPSCPKIHEVMQKFSAAPMVNCPDCGSPVKKLMSLSSFALKGTGWYTTDYKRAAAPQPAGTPEVPKQEGAEKAEGTSKTQPSSSPATSAPKAQTSAPAGAASASQGA